jgi:peptidoglycan/LPS O-acetylase OafA/YrhL
MRQPLRRYYLHSVLPIAVMTLLLLMQPAALQRLEDPLAQTTFVLLPLAPMALVLRLLLRYLRECDELERQVEVSALGCSAIATLMVAAGCALLYGAGLLPLHGGEAAVAILLTQTAVYGAARLWLQRRYP